MRQSPGTARRSRDGLSRGLPRALRGLALAVAALGIPYAAHALVDGSFPQSPAALLVGALLAAICVALADRRRGVLEIGAVVVVSQPALHVVLAAHHGGSPWRGGWAMLLAHAAAAVAVTVLLAGAERVLWALSGLGRRRLRADATAPGPLPTAPPVSVRRSASPLRPLLLARALLRRGPPVVVPA